MNSCESSTSIRAATARWDGSRWDRNRALFNPLCYGIWLLLVIVVMTWVFLSNRELATRHDLIFLLFLYFNVILHNHDTAALRRKVSNNMKVMISSRRLTFLMSTWDTHQGATMQHAQWRDDSRTNHEMNLNFSTAKWSAILSVKSEHAANCLLFLQPRSTFHF